MTETTSTRRPIPLALTMLIAVFSALVALAISGGPHAHAATGHHGGAAATVHDHAVDTGKTFSLRTDMRALWEQHVMWTRLAIISLTTGSPDTNATVARLLRNQTDIGNAVKPYYGTAAGAKLTSLLRQHILIAADLIAAAKGGDKAATTTQAARWTANADQLAAFLSGANPASWKLGAMKAMLHDHLRLTTDEVLARLGHKWTADVRAYDEIDRQALHMADMLSSGIVAQFPARFR
jgi:hypothetical protein